MRIRTTAELFALGAVCGTLGDLAHGAGHVLVYPPRTTPLLIFGVPFWVPFLMGSATIFIGWTHRLVHQHLFSQHPRPGSQSLRGAALGISSFTVLYILSGALPLKTGGSMDLVLGLAALGTWWALERSGPGLLLALLTAAGGLAAETILIQQGVFSYTNPNLHVVPSWLPWIYLTASVGVGNFVRWRLLPTERGLRPPAGPGNANSPEGGPPPSR